jgi:hypothetical protein
VLKIIAMVGIVLLIFIFSRKKLISFWIITSPFITNFVNRSIDNPFFGSIRLVQYRFLKSPGIQLESLFEFDRVVLGVLLIGIINKGVKKQFERSIEIPFYLLLLGISISGLLAEHSISGIRAAVDTYGLYLISYIVGKKYLGYSKGVENTGKAIIVLGIILMAIGIYESITIGPRLHESFEGRYRITGPFAYWENYGLFLSIVFYYLMFKLLLAKIGDRRLKISVIGLLIITMYCIYLTQTRTIMFGMLTGSIIGVIIGRNIIGLKVAYTYLILLGIIGVTLWNFPGLYQETGFYKYRLTSRTDIERRETYLAAERMFLRSPIIGIGLKEFREHMDEYVSEDEVVEFKPGGRTCHNSYLVTAAEAGLMGLLPMLILMISIYTYTWKAFHEAKDKKFKIFAIIFIGMSLTYHISGLSFDPFYEFTLDNKVYYLSLGMLVGWHQTVKTWS